MIECNTIIRVRYGETDNMGFAHHANYPLYLEEARMDLLRKAGLDYTDIESSGLIMPLVSMQFKFIKPLHFDDQMRIVTRLEIPVKLKLKFSYEIFNLHNELMTTASTTLVFVERSSGNPVRPPKFFFQEFEKPVNI